MHRKRKVILQRVSMLHKAELVAANDDNCDYHAPWVSPFTNDADFNQWFARLVTGPHVSLIAREPRSFEAVGLINLSEIVMGTFHSCFVGYYGYQRWARKGWMTAALHAAVQFAFNDLGLHRLEANIQPGNTASARLAKRVGFRKEGSSPRYLFIDGSWQDHEHWVVFNEGPGSTERSAI